MRTLDWSTHVWKAIGMDADAHKSASILAFEVSATFEACTDCWLRQAACSTMYRST